MRFRQPNWATKFFIDAILLETNVKQNREMKVVISCGHNKAFRQ